MTGDSLPHNYDQIFYNSNTNSTGDNQNIKHAINQIPYFNQNRSPAEDSVNSPASSTHSSTINQRSSAISHQHHYQTQYYNHQHHPVPNFASVPDPVAAGSGLGPFDSHPLDFGTISHGMQQQQQQQQQQHTCTGTGIGTGNITEAQFNTFPLVTPPTQSVASNPLNTHINSHFGSYISGVPIMEEKEPVSLDSLELPEIPTAEEQMSINNNKYSSNNNNDNNNNNNNNNGSSSSNSNNNNNNNNNIHTPEESALGLEDRSRGGGSKRKHNSPLNGNASQKAAKKTRFRPCDGCRKRKTRCFIPDDKRSCLECSKHGQACEYDNDKIFLFNNINTLSGVSKVVSDGSVVTKFSNESTGNTRGSSASNANANANASTNANANTNTSNKPQRTKPCDGCKRKRSKCIKVDDSSSCMECEKKNIICTYSQNVLNMFPSTGKINLLANHDIGIEKPVKDYSMLNEPTVMSSSLSLLSSQSSTIIGETSIIEKRILNFINNNSNNSNSKNKLKEKQLNAEPSIILDSPIFSIDNKHNTVRKLNDHSVFHVVNDDDDFINLKCLQCDEIEEIVGESNHYLINLYFRLVHNSFPIISKQAYYERYCRNYREIHPLLLVSVYLMALNWWELESHENEKTMKFTKTAVKPDVVKLEKIAISLMQDNIYESPKFSVLQALLLLMNYSFTIPNPYSLSSWKITSLMTSFAEEMGLNWPVSYWGNIPKWECKVRKIVAWSVLFHDKLYSLIEGRLSNIDWKNNWLVDDLNFNDFLIDNDSLKVLQQNDLMQKDEMFRRMVVEEAYDEMEIETLDTNDDKYLEQVIFIQNFKLSKSIDDMLKQLYSIRSLQNDDFNAIYSKSVPILADLSQWFELLPETVKLVNSSSSSPGDNDGIIANTGLENKQKDFQRLSLLSNGSLNLLYFTLVILIYKRLITRYIDHLQSNNDGDNNNNVSAEIVEQFTNLKPQIVSVLQTAIYKFLFNLKPFNLEPFWLLSTKRSFVFIGVVISLFAKAVDLEREKTVPMPDNNQLQSIIKTENKENASNNNTTDDGDEGDNESENNSENVNTNANDERCEKLARERVQIVDIYRDFHWKLSIFAPDFNHAQTALLHLNNLVVLKEDANSKDREWRFVL